MPSSNRYLIRAATVAGALVDCRLRDGRVAEIAPGLQPGDGDRVLDARGGALLPGLADHHIHLRALAAAARSVDLRGRPVESARDAPGDGVLRVIGALAEVTRADLDQIWPRRPVRVQHRSGALWTLNSAALDLMPGALTASERATGQFWRAAGRSRVPSPRQVGESLSEASALLASYGVTHVTDATPGIDPASLRVRQHVLSLARQGHGPCKIVIPDHEPPDFDGLVAAIRAARRASRGVALHAVTATALAVALAALAACGPHADDRIEHAAVCDDDAARTIAGLGITVVTQPALFARYGQAYLRESEPRDRPWLWRLAGLTRLGVRVAISSDAPYGDPSPWQAIRAAATRRSADADATGLPGERIAPRAALASMLSQPGDPAGPPRRVAPGEPADLCLLRRDLTTTLSTAVATGQADVMATFIRGELAYLREPSSQL